MKLCIQCKHYRPAVVTRPLTYISACAHPNNASMVDGSPRACPEHLRHGMYSSGCGSEGLWWEAIDKERDNPSTQFTVAS